ncbi:hypothetical protein KC19_5G083500 [Ceratodon purpureus]|uniref:Cation efflux protein cytoplasmic domain-containing protein n=1 Tax=Ceratodon purpureus TaxID=3225 RepID=A0A8T0I0R9_CERPU|nr:hypothetical protein KC19_5G083500 [Ceratodon purpureus]
MADQITAPLLGRNDATEVAVRDGHGDESGPPSDPAPSRPVTGKAQFMYHRMMSGKAFNDPPGASEGQREYNRVQRETLSLTRELEAGNVERASYEDKEEPLESLAITLSNVANVVLLILKIFASVKSKSLAIVASTLESLLDLLAGVILLFTRWAMKQENVYKYPIGKLRVQPVGIVIFAAIMATLGMQVVITATEQLLEGDQGRKMDSGEIVWLTVVMGIATAAKLALFLFCRTFKSEIVHAYSLDHSFDALTNIVGLAAALLANKYYWWIDPVGALILAVYTIFEWSKTVLENAGSLVGKSAPPEFLRKVTLITVSHHDAIKRIDTVRAYTFGSQYFVEVDIELPEDMHLREAHNIGETLQEKLEDLPEVERAYVHLDFESTHRPEHTRPQRHLPPT